MTANKPILVGLANANGNGNAARKEGINLTSQ